MFLYTIDQLQTTGSNNTNLTILYFISIFIAISVIIVKSPVVSILYLIGLFCLVAVYLVNSGMTFAGLIYLLVYVGAISILFIFIVMLLNVRISELLTEGKNSAILAIFSIFAIYFLLSNIIPGSALQEGSYDIINFIINDTNSKSLNIVNEARENIASVSNKSWDVSLAEISHISSVGNIFYSILNVVLIVISLIILVAMIGAIVITVKNVTKVKEKELNNGINVVTNSVKLNY